MPIIRQQELGHQLFRIWLEKHWELIKEYIIPAELVHVTIASEDSEILNLPWELMSLETDNHLGIETRISIRRYPSKNRNYIVKQGHLRPGPLRILFMACSPQNLGIIFYEKEEEFIQKAIHGLDVAFDSGDFGTFQELEQRIGEFKPHIVHLTGHGKIDSDGKGYFAFEDEKGHPDLKSSDDIRHILTGYGVQCVFVSGCYAGQAPPIEPIKGICQNLVNDRMPFAIGWASSISDVYAIEFAKNFYRAVASGVSIDQSLNLARWKLRDLLKPLSDISWILPVFYSSSNESYLFDSSKPREEPKRHLNLVRPLPGMIEGCARNFVGRRRERQQIIPKLSNNELSVVILTGLGGAGKSAFATKVVRKFQDQNHYIPISIPSHVGKGLNLEIIIEIISAAFKYPDNVILLKPEVNISVKLRHIFNVLNNKKYFLIIDNFEVNLDDSNKIVDLGVSEFYKMLLYDLSGESRVIITSRYLPSDITILPHTVYECQLGDLNPADVTKIFLTNTKFEELFRTGLISEHLIAEIQRVFGGIPRFIEQIICLIIEDPKQFEKELAEIILPSLGTPSELRKIRDDYYNSIVLEKLLGLLNNESKNALSKMAIFNIPVTLDSIKAITEIEPEIIKNYIIEWQKRALVYSDNSVGNNNLWLIYGVIRLWLFEQIDENELIKVYNAAGDYLCSIDKNLTINELGLHWTDCYREARLHYIEAENWESAIHVTSELSNYYLLHGMYDTVQELNNELLLLAPDNSLFWLGRTELEQGKYDSARDKFKILLSCLELTGNNRDAVAETLANIASCDAHQSNYSDAIDNFNRSLQIYLELKDYDSAIKIILNIISIAVHQGNYKFADLFLTDLCSYANNNGDVRIEAIAIHNLGSLFSRQGKVEEALEKYHEAEGKYHSIGDIKGEYLVQLSLAKIEIITDDYEKSFNKFDELLKKFQEIGDIDCESDILSQLAIIERRNGKYSSSIMYSEKANKLSHKIKNLKIEADSLQNFGIIFREMKNFTQSFEKLSQAQSIQESISELDGLAITFHELGVLFLQQGDLVSSKKHFINSIILYDKLGRICDIADELFYLGIIALNKGDDKAAIKLLAVSHYIYKSIGSERENDVAPHLNTAITTKKISKRGTEIIILKSLEQYQKNGVIDFIRSIYTIDS